MRRESQRLLLLGLILLAGGAPLKAAEPALQVFPPNVRLDKPTSRVQLQVMHRTASGTMRDVTREVSLAVDNPVIVDIDERRFLRPRQNGKGVLKVTLAEETIEVPLEVTGMDAADQISFANDVVPVLTKAGCNQGACHASQYGKGNFKLSLLGYAPEQDYPQFVRHFRQRRVSLVEPAQSLILRKATLDVSHGGGKRFTTASDEYQVLLSWIASGVPEPRSDEPVVVDLEVTPAERIFQPDESQQLRVVATYSDGTTRDVSHLALYNSMGEGVAQVDSRGLVTAVGPGQAAIMVRYQGQAKIAMVQQPYPEPETPLEFAPLNYVDQLVFEHWQRLHLRPSELCSDEVFIRRAFLDAIGTLPSPERVESFLASDAPDKRLQLVDELLGLTGDSSRDIYGNEWSAYWALKWGDLLRINRNKVGDGGMWAFYNWIRQSLRENKPVDQFVREIITAQGSIYANGPANYYKIASTPQDLAETTIQVFTGVRLQCARCHHHPFEVYSQADYYGLAAFFTRVGNKGSYDFGALGRDSVVMVKTSGSISHPRTRKTVPPTPLQGEPVSLEGVRDLREPLADWLTSKQNPLLARNIVNRFWGYLMGSGLVEPIDDMRATNPASIPPLLDALAEDFIAHDYDLKHLMRTIMTSRVYQLSSTPRPENVALSRFALHYNVKRLPAEVLLDAIDDVCGTQERFAGVPLGTRAIELPDSNYSSYFLDTLGRPKRVVTCECERTSQPNLAQVLHILNGDLIQKKISDKAGLIAKMEKQKLSNEDAIQRLYRIAFSRKPTAQELSGCLDLLAQAPSRKEGLEDLLWAVLNSREFLFNH